MSVLVTFNRKISQAAMEEIRVGHKDKKQILTLNDESDHAVPAYADRHLKKKDNDM